MSVVPTSIADTGVLSPSSGNLIDGKRASEETLPKNAEKTRSLLAQPPTAAKGCGVRARVNVSSIFLCDQPIEDIGAFVAGGPRIVATA